MTEPTSNPEDSEFMKALKARVASKDAAEDARLSGIMVGKVEKQSKTMLTPDWILTRKHEDKKGDKASLVKSDKSAKKSRNISR